MAIAKLEAGRPEMAGQKWEIEFVPPIYGGGAILRSIEKESS